jgi:hypothetical protein
MAITFLDHSINGKILNAFNNNVVRFSSSSSKEIRIGIVEIIHNGQIIEFELHPSPDDKFYFNFKTIVQKLINGSQFRDSIGYVQSGNLFRDDNAYIELPVQYKIIFTDDTFDIAIYTYWFVKGLCQVKEKSFYKNRGQAFPLLRLDNNEAALTIFDGYPLDIPLFGEDINIIIDPLTETQFLAHSIPTPLSTSNAITFTNDKAAQRLVLCDGSIVWDEIPAGQFCAILFNGYVLKIRKEDKCGVYLKWHNQYGGWDYYLFERNYNLDLGDKQVDNINTDFENLWDTNSPDISMGKVISETMQLWAFGVYYNEIERVKGLLHSPKVYLYTGDRYDPYTAENWLPVKVSGKSLTRPSQNRRVTISIEVELPKTYTLTL